MSAVVGPSSYPSGIVVGPVRWRDPRATSEGRHLVTITAMGRKTLPLAFERSQLGMSR